MAEYGELNQTKLLSYCGLNLAKHKKIIDELSDKGLIEKNESLWGSKTVVNYKITEKEGCSVKWCLTLMKRCFQGIKR